MKKSVFISGLFLLFLGLSFLFTKRYFSVQQASNGNQNKFQVVASFYPMYFFAQQIGTPLAHVINLTPAGSEPHDYEPSPQQIAQIQQSKLLILNGGGLELWADKVKENLKEKPVTIITTGENFQMGLDEEGTGKALDPHEWLDPVLARQQVQKILQGYVQVDPQHQSQYSQNAQELSIKLDALDQEFRTGLQSCKQKDFVTSHTAFSYLAQRYGLNQVAISGISPDEEPSPSKLAEVANFVKEHQVKVIFFESLVSPKLSQTIAQETGATTAVLNPLEGLTQEEIESEHDYFSVMRENLTALRAALECQ